MGSATQLIPKPMLPIGERPVLWHIMKIYAAYGHTDFILALGWLGEEIRKFFLNYEALTNDFTIELGEPSRISYLGEHPERGWRVSCIDTGRETLTGTRLRRAAGTLDEGSVMVTYGDGVGDIDIDALVKQHRSEGRLGTVTIVHPPGRFGEIRTDDANRIVEFSEKPQTSVGAISGGFMIFEKEAIDRYIPADDDVMFERTLLPGLAADGQLTSFVHDGFWQPMDTPREQELLEELWAVDRAPWKVWK